MNDSFSALHPALTFCYFAAVLLLTMLVLHPVFLALSLLGALGYCAVLRGWRSLGRTLGWLVPFLVLMAALNALLNHAGVTMLFYLPNGNPVTREALCYGAAAAAMFAAVILWFQCCNVVCCHSCHGVCAFQRNYLAARFYRFGKCKGCSVVSCLSCCRCLVGLDMCYSLHCAGYVARYKFHTYRCLVAVIYRNRLFLFLYSCYAALNITLVLCALDFRQQICCCQFSACYHSKAVVIILFCL